MSRLFQKRLAGHVVEMVKYLRYVFNDFFVIALMFLTGGLGLAYSNLLKHLHQGIWWAAPVSCLVLLIAQGFNHFATLIEPADRVFLIPQEVEMHAYLTRALRYSMLIASLTQVAIWVVLLPFLLVTTAFSLASLVALLLAMLLLKAAALQSAFNQAYGKGLARRYQWLINLFVLALGVFLSPLDALGFSLAYLAWMIMDHRLWQQRSLRWQVLVENETTRMLALYKFFNLFTDVPNLEVTNKRRRYLDWLVNRIHPRPANVYLYLYAHSIVRNGEYSGLYIRLTLIGAVLLFGINGAVLSILVGLLFLYLIGFQLIPFYHHFSNNVFTRIYPIPTDLRVASFKRIVATLLSVTAVLFAAMTFFGTQQLSMAALGLVVNLAETYWLVHFFITNRIKKQFN